MQPGAVRRLTASDGGEEHALDLFSHRAARSGPDRLAVHFADGCYFDGGAGEEGFVSAAQIVNRDGARLDGEAEVARDAENTVTRDAQQDGIAAAVRDDA